MAANPAITDAGTPTGAIDVPNPTTSLVGMLSSDPEGALAAAEGAAPTSKPKSGARRRQPLEPEEGQGVAADGEGGEPLVTDPPGETDPEADPEGQPPEEDKDAKALVESYKKGNERLKSEKAKLRSSVTEMAPKAALLDRYEQMLSDPATAGEFLNHLLKTVADGQHGGDVTKVLSGMGYSAKPVGPDDHIAGIKDSLFQKIAEVVPTMGFADGDEEIFANFGQKIAEMTLSAMAPLIPKTQAPVQAAQPQAALAPDEAAFRADAVSAVREIQEEVPLFNVTLEEAKAARDAYPRYALEDALRLKYGERLTEEKTKQEATVINPKRMMAPSNGKVGGDSPLSTDAVAARAKEGTAISLSSALAAFGDMPTE